MAKFEVCDPDYDDTAWRAVEADDPEDAAESYVKDACGRDPECFASFNDDGRIVLVRGKGRTVPVRVKTEMVPDYSARIVE